MRLIGCDLHASQQSIAMLDRHIGAVIEKTLKHDGEAVRDFYVSIPPPVIVGIEATGSMGWFLRLMEELAIECRVGHPVAIRKAEARRQKHDRRDAALLLRLLAEDRFPGKRTSTASRNPTCSGTAALARRSRCRSLPNNSCNSYMAPASPHGAAGTSAALT
jgi:transposase